MNILAIETSCDETAASVVQDGHKVLSNIVASQIDTHKLYGGVVPEIASRMHTETITEIVNTALKNSNNSLESIDAVAVTYAPGLIGSLLVGLNFAKALAWALNKPLIPVHHLRSHVAANYITHPDLKPPFICLVVSGGHNHIVEITDYTNFKVLGQTQDDAAGEAFDKAARAMGIPYPGGVHLDEIAENGDDRAFDFPHPKTQSGKYDFSFSGLKTSIINQIHNLKQKGQELSNSNIEDLSASFRKTLVECLCDKFTLAIRDTAYKKIVCAGGVSANRLLRRKLNELAQENNWELFIPDLKYCGDNAAMVGVQAYYEYKIGNIAKLDLNSYANMPICENK